MLIMSGIHASMAMAWFSVLSISTVRVGGLLRPGPVARAVNGIAGCLFVIIGAKVATDRG